MGAFEIPRLTVARREQIAQEALIGTEACRQGARLDIERVLIEIKGFRILAFSNLRKDFDALGIAMASGKTIYIDSDLMDSDSQVDQRRYRFTLAEEWAHTLIHGDLFAACGSFEERISLNSELGEADAGMLEMQAKALAGALLMPKAYFRDWLSRQGFLFDQEAERFESALIGRAAREYDVNEMAIVKRMELLCRMRTWGVL